MPHIRALFRDTPEIRAILKARKTAIRHVVAETLGYEPEDIAFVPEPIRPEDFELTDNMLPLEFVIQAGERWVKDKMAPKTLVRAIVFQCPELATIAFGVWPWGLQSRYADNL